MPVAVNLRERRDVESVSIIPDLCDDLVLNDGQAKPNRVAVSVARSIVDCFFEDQEDLSSLLRIQSDLVEFLRRLKVPDDSLRETRPCPDRLSWDQWPTRCRSSKPLLLAPIPLFRSGSKRTRWLNLLPFVWPPR